LEKLLAQQRDLEKRIAELQGKLAGGTTRDVLADARRVDGVTVLATRVDELDDKGLREMADRLRERIKSGVVVLGTAQGERALLLAAGTKDLIGRFHAGNRINVTDQTLSLAGDPIETELASRVLVQLYGLLEQGYPIYPADADYAIRILSSDRNAKLRDIFLDTVFISAHKRVITPKSVAQ